VTLIIQFSDTHIPPPGEKLYGTINSANRLSEALAHLLDSGLFPDALLLTGDLSEGGDARSYAQVKKLVSDCAVKLGCQIIWVNGNHDLRENFRAELLGTGAIDSVTLVGRVRIIVLDSTVAGENYGLLSQPQLDWLSEEIPRSNLPTLLVMHHPPIRSPLAGLDSDMLRNREDLAFVLRKHPVKLVVTGHAHYSGAGSCGGVPVWVGGSTASYSDVAPPAGRARIAEFGSYSRIDNYDTIARPICTFC